MKTIKWLVIIIVVVILWILVTCQYSKYYKSNILNRDKLYCYDLYHNNNKNPALCVFNKSDIDSLIQYYNAMDAGNLSPIFNFQIHEVPTDTCVYILKYLRDSTVAKVIFFNDKKGYENEVRAYVDVRTLHLNH